MLPWTVDLVSFHGGVGSLFLDTVGRAFSQKYNQFSFGKKVPDLDVPVDRCSGPELEKEPSF